jgi:hypothetical protein
LSIDRQVARPMGSFFAEKASIAGGMMKTV